MPAPLLHVQITAKCPHTGNVTILPNQPRVKVSGVLVSTVADVFAVAGCSPPGTLPPCVGVTWTAPAQHVKVMGSAVLLASSLGSGVPAPVPPIPGTVGVPLPTPPTPRAIVILSTQTRVRGT